MEFRQYQLVIYNPPSKGLLTVQEAARACRVHPEFVQRLVEMGLIEPVTVVNSVSYFPSEVVEDICRARRLHDDLGINWPGVGLALDLLERIEQLEDELARLQKLLHDKNDWFY